MQARGRQSFNEGCVGFADSSRPGIGRFRDVPRRGTAIGTVSGTTGIMTTAPAYDNSVRIGYARVPTRAQEH